MKRRADYFASWTSVSPSGKQGYFLSQLLQHKNKALYLEESRQAWGQLCRFDKSAPTPAALPRWRAIPRCLVGAQQRDRKLPERFLTLPPASSFSWEATLLWVPHISLCSRRKRQLSRFQCSSSPRGKFRESLGLSAGRHSSPCPSVFTHTDKQGGEARQQRRNSG